MISVEAEREFLLQNFRTFARLSGLVPFYTPQPHDEMCDELDYYTPQPGDSSEGQKKGLYLAPRGCGKTMLLKAYMVYRYLKNPNIRMVYGRANDHDAAVVLRSVRDALSDNQLIRRLWGDIPGRAKIWAEDQIVLARTDTTLTDPTIATTGLGRTLTGYHPDLVILDDLITDLNYKSTATTERARLLIQSVAPVLVKGGQQILPGTRWAANDIYGWLMAGDDELIEKGEEPEYRRYVRAVVNDGVWFYPTYLSPEFIDNQRRSLRLNTMLFSSWYYNLPYELGAKVFPKSLIQWCDWPFYRAPVPHLLSPDGMVPVRVSMTIDPAPTASKHSDFTGVTVVGVDIHDNWYVLYASAAKRLPTDMANEAAMVAREFLPEIISVETQQADPEFTVRLHELLKEFGLKCPIIGYNALRDEVKGERGKAQRIEALEPRFRNGKIRLSTRNSMRDLTAQLDSYPTLDHDDVLDALAMQRKVARRLQLQSEVVELADLTEWEERESWGPDGPPAGRKRVAPYGSM